MNFDLHVHTVIGSSDSSLTPEQLISESERIGLNGVCLTEHGGGWTSEMIDRKFKKSDLIVVPALEINTEFGHVIAIGLQSHIPGIHKIDFLRKTIDERGGVLILAHPMRNIFNKPPYDSNLIFKDYEKPIVNVSDVVDHEIFNYVDFIEITNGANTVEENEFALEVAHTLNKKGTGGSDSHSINGIGKSITVFESNICDSESLLENLKSGSFHAAEGLNIGKLTPFTK